MADAVKLPPRRQHKLLRHAFLSKHPGMDGEESLFRRWMQAETAAPGGVHGARAHQMRLWQEFMTGRRFVVASAFKLPERRGWDLAVAEPLVHWMRWGSWRFCKQCGHARPDSRLSSLSRPAVNDVEIICSGKVIVSCEEPDSTIVSERSWIAIRGQGDGPMSSHGVFSIVVLEMMFRIMYGSR